MQNSCHFSDERFKAFYEAWRFGAAHSETTRRRWKKQSGITSRYTPLEERFLRFAWLAAEFLEAEVERFVTPQAHFAVGLVTVSRIELLVQFHLVLRRDEVKKIPYFRVRAKRRSVVRTITELRLEEVLTLGRKCGLFANTKLKPDTLNYLKRMSYAKNLDGAFKFLRDCRNHIHPGALTRSLSLILECLPTFPEDAFEEYYFNSAVVAMNVLGALDRSVALPAATGNIPPF